MTINEIIEIIRKEIKDEEIKMKNRKQNISNMYDTAKHDFRCIDNMQDIIETYQYCIDQLEELKERLITRNNINICNL